MTLPIQKATYRARAIACGFGVAGTGTHSVFVQCAILEYSEMNGDWRASGDEITWIGHFTDAATARTVESLGHFGWLGDDLSELDDIGEDRIASIMPGEVDLVCEPEEYEGSLQLKVRWVNKPGAGKFAFKTPLTGAALKTFAAQMRGQIRGARGPGGARPAPPSTPQRQAAPASRNGSARHPNAPGGNDDIPF